MDGSGYQSHTIGTSSASYPSSAAISPHQLQHGSQLHAQSLPPPQAHNPAMHTMYGSNPHTPRTPGTPNTPASAGGMNYPPPTSQPGGRPSYPMNAYAPHQGYATSSAMMPQSSTAMSHPQPIAPAPPSGARGPPNLRPMPAAGVPLQPGLGSPYGQAPMMPQQSLLQDADQPTHVVGSQGRRGILPSAPGRPAAPVAGSASAKNQIPQKDADGKYPCPHCTKTYLHAKHLKRHLLRHTGDRPYMCVLCRDTFSRSDILKRHFQKCSIRRGNPTGASHLSHPHAHVKKNAAAQKAAGMAGEGDLNHVNGLTSMPQEVHPFGMIPVSDGMSNMGGDQQMSRTSSLNRLDDTNQRDRRNMQPSVMGSSQPYSGDASNSMAANINPQLANYNLPTGQNGMPMFGGQNPNQQQGLDWSQVFPSGAQHDAYVNTFPPNIGQNQTAIKQEHNADSERSNGSPGAGPTFFGTWGMPPSLAEPYQHLSNQILNFFYPPGAPITSHSAGMNLYFSPDNIKDFLDKYTHFHIHFAILHIPTFRVIEAYTGLLAAMCCIGACYSQRVSASHVREMMTSLQAALERDSRLIRSFATGDQPAFSPSMKRDIEELQALMLTNILFTWNGTPSQRDSIQRSFPVLATIARQAGLLHVTNSPTLYSPLHQPDYSPKTFDPSAFDWASWIEQEKRNRTMFCVYLCDTSMGIYFNINPQFDSLDIQIPLPCDDAAWDAQDSSECAAALGLHGPQAAMLKNSDGTKRSKQPEMHLALKALLHGSYQIQPGTTNLYGKFILIHAILAQIRTAQVQGSLPVMDGSSTPLAHSDWVTSGTDAGSGNVSRNNSGRGTPVDGIGQTIPMSILKTIWTALDKFKANWDADMANQFPPSSSNPRRYGFSKDGIHFFWLAKYLLKHTKPTDLRIPPDQRFTQVMQLLKSLKSWVMSDGASRGEELGSVGEIDKDYPYGPADLTLDMARLFKPLPNIVGSPGTPWVKTEIGGSSRGVV